MDCVFKCVFIDIIFIGYYITQTKIFNVKVTHVRLKKSKLDNNFGTEGVCFTPSVPK